MVLPATGGFMATNRMHRATRLQPIRHDAWPRCLGPLPEGESESRTPRVSIEYCTRCNWMLRSAWLMQELLTTFNGTLAEVALIPNHEGGGKFECMLTTATLDEEVVYCLWSRDVEGTFPEAKELKQRVRDLVDPARNLGHSDSDDNKEQKEDGTRRTAFQRLMSVIRGDRKKRGDSRTEAGRENEDRGW